MGLLSYDLIKGMTTSEKVYFKRSSKTHANSADKNYLKIYEALDKQKTYNKDTFIGLFAGTTISKYLSSEINFLNENILLSLFNFNLNKSKRNKIQKGILITEVLTSKGFKKDALKKVKVLKKNARKQEEFTLVLSLIELKEINLFKQGNIDNKDKLQALEEQRSKTTTMIRNLNSYNNSPSGDSRTSI